MTPNTTSLQINRDDRDNSDQLNIKTKSISVNLDQFQIESLKVSPDRDRVIIDLDDSDKFISFETSADVNKWGPLFTTGEHITVTREVKGELKTYRGRIKDIHDNTTASELALKNLIELLCNDRSKHSYQQGTIGETDFDAVVSPKMTKETLDAQLAQGFNDLFTNIQIVSIRDKDDNYRFILLPSYQKIDAQSIGQLVTFENTIEILGTAEIVAIHSDPSPWTKVEIITDHKSYPAIIRMLDHEDEFSPHAEVYTEDLLIEDHGQLYQITVPIEYSKSDDSGVINIRYKSAIPGNTPDSIVSLSGQIVEFDDLATKHKYVFEPDIKLDVKNSRGESLTESSKEYQDILSVVSANRLFDKNKGYHKKKFEKRLKKLSEALDDVSIENSISYDWEVKEESTSIEILAITPVTEKVYNFKAIGHNSSRWLDSLSSDQIENMGEILDSHFPERLTTNSITEAVEKTTKEFNKKHPTCSLRGYEKKLRNDGSVELFFYFSPKVTNYSITINDAGNPVTYTAEDLGITYDLPVTDKKRLRLRKKMFEAISYHYSEQGKLLAVERNDKTIPYLLEIKQDLATEVFCSTDDQNNSLEIKVISMPNTFKFDAPLNQKDKTIEPFAGMAKQFFTADKGVFSTESINAGSAELTAWYSQKGFLLKNGRLEIEIANNKLTVRADLIRLSEDIKIIADPNDGMAKKREKHIKYINNEIRQHQGDCLNIKQLKSAVWNINERFNYDANLIIDVDEPTGLATVSVRLIPNKAKGLKSFNMSGGYGNQGAQVSSSISASSHMGMKYSASINSYLGSSYGASLNTTTPRMETGGIISYAANGSYMPGYLSAIGTRISYSAPIGNSNWSMIYSLGLEKLFGPDAIYYLDTDGNIKPLELEGIDSLYIKPSIGLGYAEKDFSFNINAGPRFGTKGFTFVEISAGIYKRYNLNDSGSLYAEAYAKAGILLGNVPIVALYKAAPISLHGAHIQNPAFIKAYAVAGASLMTELPLDLIDFGIGVKGGQVGTVMSIGAGLVIKVKLFGGFSLMIGPSLVNGVPTPLTISVN